jgi:hypothetical protein
MIYRAAKGSVLTDDQAQQYGDHISSRFGNGHLEVTPEDIVEDARSAEAPTHAFFEWDNTTAAMLYRIQQARYLLRSIYIVVTSNDVEIETRAFVNITKQKDEQEPRRFYTNVEYALTKGELRQQVIAEALRQLESWRKRWSEYSELGIIFAAIEQAREQISLDLVPT